MAPNHPQRVAVAIAFNEAINDHDLNALVALMTDDHCFIDSADQIIQGREAVREAWRDFFATFPDYRNIFNLLLERGDRVMIAGHSTSSIPALRGPALWTAVVRGNAIAEWRVYSDDDDTRRALDLPLKEASR
jgi:ketosteroid isomerase-like protein